MLPSHYHSTVPHHYDLGDSFSAQQRGANSQSLCTVSLQVVHMISSLAFVLHGHGNQRRESVPSCFFQSSQLNFTSFFICKPSRLHSPITQPRSLQHRKMPTPSGFYRLWSLSTAALSFILFGLSVAGLVVSRKSLKLRYRHFGGIRIYMPGQPMNDVYPPSQRDRSNPNWAYANRTGWNYQLVPRNLQYGNEFVVLGCSVAILVLVLLPLLTSVFAKPRPVRPPLESLSLYGLMNHLLTMSSSTTPTPPVSLV